MNLKFLSEEIFLELSDFSNFGQKVSFHKNFLPISSRLGLKYVTHLHHGLMQLIEFQIFQIRGCRIIGTDIIFDTICGHIDRTVRILAKLLGNADYAHPTDSAGGELERTKIENNGKIIFSPLAKVYLSGSLA